MTIAKISNTGFLLMGILVLVLWGFVLTNRLVLRRANLEAIRTMRELESLKVRTHLKLPSRDLGPRKKSSVTHRLKAT
jgi:hypothetical protein